MKYALTLVLLLIIISVCGWWAGGFGVLMGVVASIAAAALFASKTNILSLPPAARSILKFVVFLCVTGIIAVGAIPRLQAAAEKKTAAMAALAEAARPGYSEVLAGAKEMPLTLKPGKNYLSMMPGANTGCLVAPDGWYLSEEHDRKYKDLPPCPPGQKRKSSCGPRHKAVRVWVNCKHDGVGVRSYGHSEFRPNSVRVWNDTDDAVSDLIYLAPLGR